MVARPRAGRLAAALALLLAAGWGLVGGRGAALVDWRDVRAVVFESDDWGLCGFFPDAQAAAAHDRAAFATGAFPEVYWGSTLEDSASVARLATVLAGAHGRDGLPAVLQPNYILSSLAWDADGGGRRHWRVRDLPDLPPAYARPGLWTAVAAAAGAGVWHPELHGRWHYDPARRRERGLASPAAREATARHVLLFPGSEAAWELGPWRPRAALTADLDTAVTVFAGLFGRAPRAVIAPDYRWDDRCERLWLARGLGAIQAKRGQRRVAYDGLVGRARKVLERTAARLVRRDRVYLDRNALFEPVQHADPAAVTARCADEIGRAWRAGEPAIVETHRVNFAHLDTAVAARGRAELAALLERLDGAPAGRPLYLVDGEVAGLQRRGTSWVARGDRVVVRNGTRSRRVVALPGGPHGAGRAVSLGPGEIGMIPAAPVVDDL